MTCRLTAIELGGFKLLILLFAMLAYATSAQAAEVWACSYVVQIGVPNNLDVPVEYLPEVYRFEVSPSEVTTDIGSLKDAHFRIIRNDDHELVATGSTELSDDNQTPQIIFTVGISKVSGEFGLALFTATAKVQDWLGEKVTHGRCVKS